MLLMGEVTSIRKLAEYENITDAYIRQTIRLAYLAPDIVEAILDGHHPPNWTIKLPRNIAETDWLSQKAALASSRSQEFC